MQYQFILSGSICNMTCRQFSNEKLSHNPKFSKKQILCFVSLKTYKKITQSAHFSVEKLLPAHDQKSLAEDLSMIRGTKTVLCPHLWVQYILQVRRSCSQMP